MHTITTSWLETVVLTNHISNINCHFSVLTFLSKPELFDDISPLNNLMSNKQWLFWPSQLASCWTWKQTTNDFTVWQRWVCNGLRFLLLLKLAIVMQLKSLQICRLSSLNTFRRGVQWTECGAEEFDSPTHWPPPCAPWGFCRLVALPWWQDNLAPCQHRVVPPVRMLLSSTFKSFWCHFTFNWEQLHYADAVFSAPGVLHFRVLWPCALQWEYLLKYSTTCPILHSF